METQINTLNTTGQMLVRALLSRRVLTVQTLSQRQVNLILSLQDKLEFQDGKWYIRRNGEKREKRGFFHLNRFSKAFFSSEK